MVVGVYEQERQLESVHLRLFNENDAQLVIRIENNRIVPYPDGITKLFCSLPMIGTEAFGFPLVLNSKKFVPHLERDGISLTANDIDNRAILKDAVIAHRMTIEALTTEKVDNWSCIVRWPIASFKSEPERTWYKTEVIDKIKATYLAAGIVKTGEDWIKLVDAIVPYAPKEVYTDNELLGFYDLVHSFCSDKLPQRDDYLNWYKRLDFSIFTGLNYDLEDFVKELSELGSLKQIAIDESKKYDWFNEVLTFVLLKDHDLLDKYGIIPNRHGNFVRRKDPIYWNDEVDEFLFQVHSLMTGEDFEEVLIHAKINVTNLFEGERKKTTHDLAKAIDDAFSEYQGNKQDPDFLKALRLTFQWARESGLPEKELKELFKWFASHRPQLFLETFNEDDRDKAFSIVQSGKLASLSKLAESALSNEQINSMVQIGNSGVDISKISELAEISKFVSVDKILKAARDLEEEEREREFKQQIGEDVENILNDVFNNELPYYEAKLVRAAEYDILIRKKVDHTKQYYIELKSIKESSSEYIKMGIQQAIKAKQNPTNYALLLIRRPTLDALTHEYLRANLKCHTTIGLEVVEQVNRANQITQYVQNSDDIKLQIKDPTMKVELKQEYIEAHSRDFRQLRSIIHDALN